MGRRAYPRSTPTPILKEEFKLAGDCFTKQFRFLPAPAAKKKFLLLHFHRLY
jgi:hypothetical protein